MLYIDKILKLTDIYNILFIQKNLNNKNNKNVQNIGINFSLNNIEIEYMISFYIFITIEKIDVKEHIYNLNNKNSIDFLLLWAKYLVLYLENMKKYEKINEDKKLNITLNALLKLNPNKSIKEIITNEKLLNKNLLSINSEIEYTFQLKVLKNLFDSSNIIVFNLENILKKEIYDYFRMDFIQNSKYFYNFIKNNIKYYDNKIKNQNKPITFIYFEKIKKEFINKIKKQENSLNIKI